MNKVVIYVILFSCYALAQVVPYQLPYSIESKEFIEASEDGDKEKIIYECTDLLFHMMVAIAEQDIDPSDIYRELYKRFGKKKKDYTLDE